MLYVGTTSRSATTRTFHCRSMTVFGCIFCFLVVVARYFQQQPQVVVFVVVVVVFVVVVVAVVVVVVVVVVSLLVFVVFNNSKHFGFVNTLQAQCRLCQSTCQTYYTACKYQAMRV